MKTVKLTLTLAASLALTSCASLTTPSPQRIVVCPNVAMQQCPDLAPLESNTLEHLKMRASGWISSYGECRVKHEVLRECVLEWEATTKR